ncbi:MAG: MFS transporter [Lachnospiraceae bacterium]|nr:MFS transporter [Lachnospiraceae bacterium]
MGKKEKKNEKGIPYGARERMPLWYGAVWSTRGIAAAINVVLCMNIAFYCTDIVGLSAAVVGTLFLVSKIVDAFTDLGFGFLLDKTHTKWGKARPYEVFIIFEWIFTVLMFNIPNVSTTVQYIWLFIMYTMVNAVCATALGGIDSVYMARAFTTEGNRIKAMSINGFIVMFCSIVFNIVFPSWLAGKGTTQAGWTTLVISLAVVMSVIGILRFVFCKEIVEDEADEKGKAAMNDLTLKESLGLVAKNKYLFIVVGLMFLTFIVNNMQTATTYYFKYIYGDLAAQGTAAITSMVVVPALVVFPALSKKFGTTKILQACCLIGTIGLVIRTIGGPNMPTIILGGLLFGIGTLPISMMINTYLIDCMDYGEWKTGVRIEGLVASIANFASKVGQGVAVGLVGVVMGIAGYDGMAAVQSASANNAIVFLYNLLPIAIFVLMFILSLMYKVDSIRPQMNEDLAAMHAQHQEQ